MIQRHHLETLPYFISPNDVNLYIDQLQKNMNVFAFFDDDGRARHPLITSRKIHEQVANLLNWKEHYALITSLPRLLSNITKHTNQEHFCLRCLGHFSSEEVLARHKELCTRDDFMSALNILPLPVLKHAQIKFNQCKYCTKAPLVIYADSESILEPLNHQVKNTTYTKQHKVYAAAVILTSSFYNFDQRTVMKVRENALAEFLDSLIVWIAEIVAILWTTRTIKRLSARQQKEYDNATRCYICRHEFLESEAKGPKVRDHDHITGLFIGAAHRQCNLERSESFKIPVFFHNFRGYDAHLIVLELIKRPDREINLISQNMEKYFQVEWGKNMVFRDSL